MRNKCIHTVASQSRHLVLQIKYYHRRTAETTLQLHWDICGTNLKIIKAMKD